MDIYVTSSDERFDTGLRIIVFAIKLLEHFISFKKGLIII